MDIPPLWPHLVEAPSREEVAQLRDLLQQKEETAPLVATQAQAGESESLEDGLSGNLPVEEIPDSDHTITEGDQYLSKSV